MYIYTYTYVYIYIGTGKSKLMRSIANIMVNRNKIKIFEISHDILLSRFVGEGEIKLRSIFKDAHRYVCMHTYLCMYTFTCSYLHIYESI
jgi:AAA+ superfamily predicted ATPase